MVFVFKIVHSKDHAYEVTQSFVITSSRRGAVRCVEEVSTRVDAFVMRYVGVERRDVQGDENGIVGCLSELLEFVKEDIVYSAFMKDRCQAVP